MELIRLNKEWSEKSEFVAGVGDRLMAKVADWIPLSLWLTDFACTFFQRLVDYESLQAG
jgi:hypothetical protein